MGASDVMEDFVPEKELEDTMFEGHQDCAERSNLSGAGGMVLLQDEGKMGAPG